MSIPDSVDESVDDRTVEDLGHALGAAITDLPEYEAFEEAKAAVEADEDLQAEIDAFERQRQEFMLARQSGDATQEDMLELQRAQQELHSKPLMADYLDAQEELEDRLEAVNEAISDPLALDFGEAAGGCCKD